MKISTMPTRSADSPERKESTILVKSSPVEPPIIHDNHQPRRNSREEPQESIEQENSELNDRSESKLPLSMSTKTDGIKETGDMSRLTRSKRISCQDTIHEAEEDDGLTMDRVGK